jgi:hypothetical protein
MSRGMRDCSVCQQLPLKRARYLDGLLGCEQALWQADVTLHFIQHFGRTLDSDYRSPSLEAVADVWRSQLADIGQRVSAALEALVGGELPIDRLCQPTPALYDHVVAGMHHFEQLNKRQTAQGESDRARQYQRILELQEPERTRLLRLMSTPMSEEVAAAGAADDERLWQRALERAHRSGDLQAPDALLF